MTIPIIQQAQNPYTGVFGTGQIAFFTSSQTWTVPAGVTAVRVRLWGAGGAGQNATSFNGGGGGGFALKTIYDLQGATSVAITVGRGIALSSGGTSSFGSFVSATGGGHSTTAGTPVPGGTGVGGDINNTGGSGFNPGTSNNGGGGGAAGLFGSGGSGTSGSGSSGCSGAGGSQSALSGGNGIFGNGAFYYAATYTTNAIPSQIGVLQTIPSIDFIATGGGGVQALPPSNGGGGGSSQVSVGSGAFPGGGGSGGGLTLGGNGLVIVEW